MRQFKVACTKFWLGMAQKNQSDGAETWGHVGRVPRQGYCLDGQNRLRQLCICCIQLWGLMANVIEGAFEFYPADGAFAGRHGLDLIEDCRGPSTETADALTPVDPSPAVLRLCAQQRSV